MEKINKQTNISTHNKACKLLNRLLSSTFCEVLLNGHINICFPIFFLCIGQC